MATTTSVEETQPTLEGQVAECGNESPCVEVISVQRPKATEAAPCDVSSDPFVQNLFVLCHGEHVEYSWDHAGVNNTVAASGLALQRPWDPPLTDRSKLQAWRLGRTIRLEDWNVTRVVVSPFLRCVQTAAEVIAGLCLMPSSVTLAAAAAPQGESHPTSSSTDGSPSIKVSIECGLAEMTRRGVTYPSDQGAANKDPLQPWTWDLPELYSMLPPEVQDPNFRPIRQELPSSRETAAEVQHRYTTTFQMIANRYPYENILCITHGEGVRQSVSMMLPRAEVWSSDSYSACTHGQRPNFGSEDGTCIMNGDWELLTESGPASGVYFGPSNSH